MESIVTSQSGAEMDRLFFDLEKIQPLLSLGVDVAADIIASGILYW